MPMFEDIAAVILAGGESRRMLDTDKPLALLGNKTLIQHCIERIRPQVRTLYLSVNGDKTRFSQFDLALIQDDFQPPLGPLGGLYSAINKIQLDSPSTEWLLCAPGDAPFLPLDLCERLLNARKNTTSPIFASDANDQHYLCSIWPLNAKAPINSYLQNGGRSVRGLLHKLQATECRFETYENSTSTHTSFSNINTLDDLQNAKLLYARDIALLP